jgi:DNA mismatch repair protein MutL
MSMIRILPEILSNKIAAGEVVERPASVVKELVENAIDAHSTRITVEIANGGKNLIRVSDNGCGMSHDDALLCLERYATSKIQADPDLYAIKTLGFRGEAIPSIASVSKFSMVTSDRSDAPATRVYVEGGKILQVEETGGPPGTMISVSHLFFNTPARRKFLKTTSTEMGHIADTVSAIALGFNRVQFRLVHNNRAVKDWPAAKDGRERIVDVLGSDLREGLYRLPGNGRNPAVSGWVSDPALARKSSQRLYIYINGRFIRDRGISYAITDGYKGRLMKGRFPVGAVFIDLPPEEVDVNVHPTKHEVRFLRQKEVYQAVREAVAEALGTGLRQPGRDAGWAGNEKEVFHPPENSFGEEGEGVSESTGAFGLSEETETPPLPHRGFKSVPRAEPADTRMPEKEEPGAPPDSFARQSGSRALQEQSSLWEQRRFSGMTVLGQFKNTYIICQSGDTLFLIDQHAAHERILYERLSAERNRKGAVQNLMIPETVELNYRESAVLSELTGDLEAIGIHIEPFGGNTFIVKAVPALLSDRPVRPLITDIAETAVESGYTPGLEQTLEQCLILTACHAAIRANQALSEKEMRALLDGLDRCENPFNCPHGRPTLIQWTQKELEKRFRRIV